MNLATNQRAQRRDRTNVCMCHLDHLLQLPWAHFGACRPPKPRANILRLAGPFGRNNTPSMASQPSPRRFATVNPFMDAAGNASLRFTPPPMTHPRRKMLSTNVHQ